MPGLTWGRNAQALVLRCRGEGPLEFIIFSRG